ncbi:hypothetical protein GCM10017786_73300 [Amycolatopsis deserti]|uniref:Uncharacterized protein n=1 Tax=Amycolatopsis deserti TaxID=185696 RepID=A0ABQ3JGC9_9PSEU|nr:hypothetical protein GCM10017786_73300 [Amycolatopsis deserti]
MTATVDTLGAGSERGRRDRVDRPGGAASPARDPEPQLEVETRARLAAEAGAGADGHARIPGRARDAGVHSVSVLATSAGG